MNAANNIKKVSLMKRDTFLEFLYIKILWNFARIKIEKSAAKSETWVHLK